MNGLVDIHAHVLPGVDDGPGSLADAVEFVRNAAESGVTLLAATPHLRPDFPDVRVDEIGQRLEEVRVAVATEGIDVTLVRGSECSVVWVAGASEAELREASFGGSGRDLLLETPTSGTAQLSSVIFSLQRRGYRVTLAHPERSLEYQRRPEELIRLVQQGTLLQINADSLLGPRSPRRKLAVTLCRSGLAGMVASDGHGGNPRRGIAVLPQAADWLETQLGPEIRERLTASVPRAVLLSHPLPPSAAPDVEALSGHKVMSWRRR